MWIVNRAVVGDTLGVALGVTFVSAAGGTLGAAVGITLGYEAGLGDLVRTILGFVAGVVP